MLDEGVVALVGERSSGPAVGPGKIHTPEEIAARLGGMSVKSLSELIRHRALETTTLGHVGPSPRGGRKRRLWGMTDAQHEALLAVRRRPPAAPEARPEEE